jgi:hypothetical protein
MKKAAVILLLVIYSSTTMGATIHLHYCMNDFVGWSLRHGKNNKCGKCGMKEKKDGCCKDEHKQIKLKAEHQKSTPAQYIQTMDAAALITPTAAFSFRGVSIPLNFPLSNAPPEISKERLYILHSVFLI